MEELSLIRQIWLDEKHEFEDSLPRIYREETGHEFNDGIISKNKYFGTYEAELLREVCDELYHGETLLFEMQRTLLDIEAKAAAISNKRHVIQNFEAEIGKASYRDEDDAYDIARRRADKYNDAMPLEGEEDFVE